jgi:hypothetical protein
MIHKTQRENDKTIGRKLTDMTKGHEANLDTDDERIRVKVHNNQIIKTTITPGVTTAEESSPEDILTEQEITLGDLEILIADHILMLDGRTSITKGIQKLSSKYNSHQAREITDE